MLPTSAGVGTARRFFVPKVSSESANDHEYFRKIDGELHDGGYEALLYHLLHEVDIRDFNVRAVPKTAALAEQAAYSRKGIDLLVEIACKEGVVPCQASGHQASASPPTSRTVTSPASTTSSTITLIAHYPCSAR